MIEKIVAVIFSVLILVAIAIPLTSDMVAASVATVSTVSNEQFNGTAAVGSTLSEYVASVTSFYIQTIETKSNITALASTANGTRTLNLSTPIGQGSANLTVVVDAATHENTSIGIGTTYIGNLNDTAGLSHTFTVPTSLLAAGNVINFTYYDNSSGAGVTNFTLVTPYWATSTAYGVSGGEIVPTADGNYLTSYEYAMPTTGMTLLALSVLPIMLGVLALVFVANLLD
jgi:hypothetical protein